MFKFCEAEIDGIVCTFIKSETVIEVRQHMQERYASAKTLPGTRSYHQFIPLLHSKIGAKYVSEEEQFAFTFDFNITPKAILREVKLSEFVSCIYDECPWIGVVEEIDVTSKDVLIKFLHPSRSYHWPSREDLCWVPNTHILCSIKTPTTATWRRNQICVETFQLLLINITEILILQINILEILYLNLRCLKMFISSIVHIYFIGKSCITLSR